MKPEARVFEITSLTKKISFNYHFNEFFELKYCFWQAEFECVTYLLLTGICHLLAACWPLIILNFIWICIPRCEIVSSEQARCSRKWQNTDFDNRNPLRMRKGVS